MVDEAPKEDAEGREKWSLIRVIVTERKRKSLIRVHHVQNIKIVNSSFKGSGENG